MSIITNLIPRKLHPITGEDLKPTIVTNWIDGSPMSDAKCGGLFNKDAEPLSATFGSYFKWNSSGAYGLDRLVIFNESNFKKLISDYGINPQTIIVNRIVPITSTYTIPANINLVVENGGGFLISTGTTLKVLGDLSGGCYQIFYGEGRTDLNNSSVPVEWYGAKADYDGTTVVTDSAGGIQRAINSAKGTIMFSKGKYYVDSSIRVYAKAKLIGVASTGGTEIVSSGSYTEPVLNCKDYDNVRNYWHHGSVKNIRVTGGGGDGIYIYQPGENVDVTGVTVVDCAGNGLVVYKPIPCRLGSLSFYRNGISGIKFEACEFVVKVDMISGDDNAVLVYILGGAPQASFVINAIKSERNGINPFTGEVGHKNIILAENADRSNLVIGALHWLCQVSAAGCNLIEYKRSSGIGEYINLDIGALYGNRDVVADYDYGYYNSVIGPHITLDDFKGRRVTHGLLSIVKDKIHTFMTHAGTGVVKVYMNAKIFSGGYISTKIEHYTNGKITWPDFSVGIDAPTVSKVFDLLSGNSLRLRNGSYSDGHLILGAYHIWIDTTGKLRVKNGTPTIDLDGDVLEYRSSLNFPVVKSIVHLLPAIDASKVSKFRWYLEGDATVPAPTNPTNGQNISLAIKQDSTGGRILTWDPIFSFANNETPILSVTPQRTDYLFFEYVEFDLKWRLLSFEKSDNGTNKLALAPLKGSGSPEGAVNAPVGTIYTRTNGGAGSTLYIKESGTGSVGWVAK